MKNRIYPSVWCNNNASEIADFYTGQAEHIIQKVVPTLMFTGRNNGKAEEAVGVSY